MVIHSKNIEQQGQMFISSFRSILIHWKMHVHQPEHVSRGKVYSRMPFQSCLAPSCHNNCLSKLSQIAWLLLSRNIPNLVFQISPKKEITNGQVRGMWRPGPIAAFTHEPIWKLPTEMVRSSILLPPHDISINIVDTKISL